MTEPEPMPTRRHNQPALQGPRGVALALAAGAIVAGALAAVVLLLTNTDLAPSSRVAPPPANGPFSYQLGGAYPPEPGVKVVSRDRFAAPAVGLYNICYVNLLQTQPDEPGQSSTDPPYGTTQWWKNNHPDLLLEDSAGEVIVDAEWNEALFDVRTAAARDQLLAVQSGWFSQCRDDGFQAIEPDNLDAHLRSAGLLTFAQTKAYLKLVVSYVHALGLAIAQKNTADSPDGYGRHRQELRQRYGGLRLRHRRGVRRLRRVRGVLERVRAARL